MSARNPGSAATLVDAEGYALTPAMTATIADTASLSAAVILDGKMPCGFYIPASFEGGNLQFQASHDGETFFDVYDEDGEKVQLVAASSTFVQISNPVGWLGTYAMKIRSVTSGGDAQAQTSAAAIVISLQGA